MPTENMKHKIKSSTDAPRAVHFYIQIYSLLC